MRFRRAAMRPPFFSQKQPLRGAKHFPHPVPCRLRHETARVSSLYAVLPDHARLLTADSEGAGILFIEGFPKKTVPSAASRASTAYLQYHRKGRFLLMNLCPAESPGAEQPASCASSSPGSNKKSSPPKLGIPAAASSASLSPFSAVMQKKAEPQAPPSFCRQHHIPAMKAGMTP